MWFTRTVSRGASCSNERRTCGTSGAFKPPMASPASAGFCAPTSSGCLSDADLAVLAGQVKVARTVDLRGRDEVAAIGPGRLVDVGVEHVHLPVRDQANNPEALAARRELTQSQSYMRNLSDVAERYVAAVDALTHDAVAIVHCTAGKDRTGLTAMLVLGALGVPDECLIDDYAATARVPPDIKAASRDPKAEEFWAEYLVQADTMNANCLADAQAPEQMEQTMREVLEGIRDRWGSIPGYLDAHDGGHLRDRLRRRLL